MVRALPLRGPGARDLPEPARAAGFHRPRHQPRRHTDDAAAFVRRYGLTYPQLREGDGSDRRDAYGMTGFPESFLVDPSGQAGADQTGRGGRELPDRSGRATDRIALVIRRPAHRRPRSRSSCRVRRSRNRGGGATGVPARRRGRGDVHDLRDAAGRVGLAPGRRERALIRKPDRPGQGQGPDQGRARRPVRAAGPRHPERTRLRPARLAGAGVGILLAAGADRRRPRFAADTSRTRHRQDAR